MSKFISKKEYLAPQISVIMIEPQAILAGSGPTSSSITTKGEIMNGDDVKDEDNVWE